MALVGRNDGWLDSWMEHAKGIIYSTDGVAVSVKNSHKDILQFGRNRLVGTSSATLQRQPAGVLHETYVSSNLINSVISTSAADTEVIVVEGQTSDDGLVFAFASQTVTLNGQSAVALTTPLARVTRSYNISATTIAGVVSITETDTYTAGVPATASKVHLQIAAGSQTSFKASTTISSSEYWVITSFYADVLKKTAAFAEVDLEIREPGGVFRTRIMLAASTNQSASHRFAPYLIIKPNSDIRLTAIADAASTDISGGIEGTLLS